MKVGVTRTCLATRSSFSKLGQQSLYARHNPQLIVKLTEHISSAQPRIPHFITLLALNEAVFVPASPLLLVFQL